MTDATSQDPGTPSRVTRKLTLGSGGFAYWTFSDGSSRNLSDADLAAINAALDTVSPSPAVDAKAVRRAALEEIDALIGALEAKNRASAIKFREMANSDFSMSFSAQMSNEIAEFALSLRRDIRALATTPRQDPAASEQAPLPCPGNTCLRADGVTCPDDTCDIATGIYERTDDSEELFQEASRATGIKIGVIRAAYRAVCDAAGEPAAQVARNPSTLPAEAGQGQVDALRDGLRRAVEQIRHIIKDSSTLWLEDFPLVDELESILASAPAGDQAGRVYRSSSLGPYPLDQEDFDGLMAQFDGLLMMFNLLMELEPPEHLLAKPSEFAEWIIAKVEQLTEALRRLGSMETLTLSQALDPIADRELIARIDFAQAALAQAETGADGAGGEREKKDA